MACMLRTNPKTRPDHRPHPSRHVLTDASRGRLSPAFWVVLYFTLNLSLTLYNKYVLIHFPFPYTLTALHALCGTIGTSLMLHFGGRSKKPSVPGEKESTTTGTLSEVPNLTLKETVVVLLFSLLYTVNIVVSNASLKLVTVPFHQVVRGSTPLFTIALSAVLFNKRSSRAKLIALIPVIAGVGFATYGDYYCTLFGFCLTLLGTILASFKTVITHHLLRPPTLSSSSSKHRLSAEPIEKEFSSRHRRVPSIFKYSARRVQPLSVATVASSAVQAFKNIDLPKLSLSPMQLLYLMSPLAFIQTSLFAYFTGELAAVNQHLRAASMAAGASHSPSLFGWNVVQVLESMGLGRLGIGMPSGWLIMNGVMAFALNVVSFYANKKIGAVGMSVAANVKQVLTVLCAVVLFNLTITTTNGVGILLTLLGGAWYARLELKEKAEEKERNSKIG
ncbi:hypothetical protein NMY22_g8262 [Coprinellus aureogranulatus]|nr:hypothetical protein NMY22_g8262 [Coprinellus aureogranulatus]